MEKNFRLKAEIILAGKTEIELAQEANINYSRLSHLINGWRQPSEKEKEVISQILGKNKNEIFKDVG